MSSSRKDRDNRLATMRSRSSPTAWPKRSLICLKPSRSRNNSASGDCFDSGRPSARSSRSRKWRRLGSAVSPSCRARWRACCSPARVPANSACACDSPVCRSKTSSSSRGRRASSRTRVACNWSSAATHWRTFSAIKACDIGEERPLGAGSAASRSSRSFTALIRVDQSTSATSVSTGASRAVRLSSDSEPSLDSAGAAVGGNRGVARSDSGCGFTADAPVGSKDIVVTRSGSSLQWGCDRSLEAAGEFFSPVCTDQCPPGRCETTPIPSAPGLAPAPCLTRPLGTSAQPRRSA